MVNVKCFMNEISVDLAHYHHTDHNIRTHLETYTMHIESVTTHTHTHIHKRMNNVNVIILGSLKRNAFIELIINLNEKKR